MCAKWYPRDELPSDETFEADANAFAVLLGHLYNAQDFGFVPGAPAPEVIEAIAVAEAVSKGKSAGPTGQGFGLTQSERRAVEFLGYDTRQARVGAP